MKTFKALFVIQLLVICMLLSIWSKAYAATEPLAEPNRGGGYKPRNLAEAEQETAEKSAVQKKLVNFAQKSRYDNLVEKIAQLYGLESALLHAVITVESHYVSTAVSHKGAAGLMQLMPMTAKRYGVADVFDPAQNLKGGAKYLRYLLDLFNSDLNLALAAYNGGENLILRNGRRVPRSTSDFVMRVLGFYEMYQVVPEPLDLPDRPIRAVPLQPFPGRL